MSIQVLVSTMNRSSIEFLNKMNLSTDVVVGNQNGEESVYIVEDTDRKITVACTNQKGLSNNRNTTLKYASAEICLLADDDVEYVDGYESLVMSKFSKHPNADIIVFNIIEDPIVRYVIRNEHVVGRREYLKYGSVRIAFRRKSIVNNNIRFDPEFGTGSNVPMGEDNLFLHDCLYKGLTIIACPDYLLKLKNDRESTWFNGYNDVFLKNKKKFFMRLNHKFWVILCIQDVLRHRKLYKENGTVIHNLKCMIID